MRVLSLPHSSQMSWLQLVWSERLSMFLLSRYYLKEQEGDLPCPLHLCRSNTILWFSPALYVFKTPGGARPYDLFNVFLRLPLKLQAILVSALETPLPFKMVFAILTNLI